MLDISSLDMSLKIKSLGRMLRSQHPFLLLLKSFVDLSDFFYPECQQDIESCTSRAIKELRVHRISLLANGDLLSERNILAAARSTKLNNVVSVNGRNSIPFFSIWRSGKRLIGDLAGGDLAKLRRYIKPEFYSMLESAVRYNLGRVPDTFDSILINKKLKPIEACTSKEIRESLNKNEAVIDHKLGHTLTQAESLSWGLKLSKVNSVRHRNILLRVAHGDVYTKEKLVRFNLSQDDQCSRCGNIETLKHKFIECPYVQRIWQATYRVTNQLMTNNQETEVTSKACIGAQLSSNVTILTINAEILLKIYFLKEGQNYLLHPKTIIEQALNLIARREKNSAVKNSVNDLLLSLSR